MTISDILPATLFLLLSLSAVISTAWWHRRPPHLSRRVLVTLVSSDQYTLRGVVWQVRGRWVILRDAAVLHADGRVTVMDGELLVDQRNIAFVQAVAHGGEQLRAAG